MTSLPSDQVKNATDIHVANHTSHKLQIISNQSQQKIPLGIHSVLLRDLTKVICSINLSACIMTLQAMLPNKAGYVPTINADTCCREHRAQLLGNVQI